MTEYFDGQFFGEAFVTLVVIMDPLGTVPIFLALTGGRSSRVRGRLARQAVLTAFLLITVFALFGETIFDYLGIGIPALQVAGGLLLALVALQLLTGAHDLPTENPDVSIALVPLGTPLLAGPGAIVAAIVFVRRADDLSDAISLALAIAAVHVVLFLSLRFSVVILRVVRESGILLLTRVSGLLLSAIAVQLVANGVRAFIAEG